ncbi:MAG TPA: MarR family transcriptional regulator [Acidimicrobiales bacterium]|nr:MarR family transcriptional regulator [Acidimicrobiales bacterium]
MRALLAASRVLVAMSASSIETSPVEVTLNQYRALVVLATSSPIRMSDLARELHLSASSATRLVERLEKKELVARAMSETSRRSIDLRLLPAGEELVALVMAERRRQFHDLLSGLPERRQAAMRRAFEELAQLAGEPVDEVSPALLGRVARPR